MTQDKVTLVIRLKEEASCRSLAESAREHETSRNRHADGDIGWTLGGCASHDLEDGPCCDQRAPCVNLEVFR